MGSHEQSDNISMFPNRRTVDSIASSLDELMQPDEIDLNQVEAMAQIIINHPSTTPAHYAKLLPVIRAALAHVDANALDVTAYPHILTALEAIEHETHPSFAKRRLIAGVIIERYFQAPQ